ncbi:MAG TPA: helix-turn-helix domain-containing protein [Candidatus Levilactobacillus faecigallinarum]|uniref:Helix-turn-helix domain-containing protein n=1 Tax=Candidatus Levilactobacillus faecigallinarum TaxID=2838638 RepID=A0A9D1QTA0_9LACO|nr:helix-turn-helix domain-containing protein [Candidatus Levilactobacillus faecigallinarum]
MDSLVTSIKNLASANGKTLEEVGKATGIGEKSIYRWDKVPPRIVTLKKVGKYFGIDYRLLLPTDKDAKGDSSNE